MKSILIIGTPRSGKTTLCTMLKLKFPNYSIIHTDSIKNSVMRHTWNDVIDDVVKKSEFEFSTECSKILVDIFNSHVKEDISSNGYIMEGSQLLPSVIKNKIDLNKIILIVLGYGDKTKKDILNLCEKYDTEAEWSFHQPRELLKIQISYWIKLNKKLKKECKKYNIKYYETFDNRNEKLKDILFEIECEINSK